jgi:hypothetical protein
VTERARHRYAECERTVIAHAPVHRQEQDLVAAAVLHLAERAHTFCREDAPAGQFAAVREHRVHAGERARRELAIRCRDDRLHYRLAVPVERLAERLQCGAELREFHANHLERGLGPLGGGRLPALPLSRWLGPPIREQRPPAELVVGHADEHPVETKRVDEFVLQEGLQPPTADLLDQAADDPAVRERVIAMMLARAMRRLCARDHVEHVVPVEHLRGRFDHVRNAIEAGLVAKHMPDRDRVLAVLAELRPVPCDPIVVIREATIDEDVKQRGDDTLRGRERSGRRVLEPGPALTIAIAAPDVDDRFAFVVHAHCRSRVFVFRDLTNQCGGDVGEIGMNLSVQHQCARSSVAAGAETLPVRPDIDNPRL